MIPGYLETVRLADGVSIDARVAPDRTYRLALNRRGRPLVEFWNEGAVHHRRIGDRIAVYEFRSIEQLRYDFERDAEDALDRD
jgi:hypothetical protein